MSDTFNKLIITKIALIVFYRVIKRLIRVKPMLKLHR
jgi:hypothetical protein